MTLKEKQAKADAQIRAYHKDRKLGHITEEYGYVKPDQLTGWRKPTEAERSLVGQAAEKSIHKTETMEVCCTVATFLCAVIGIILRIAEMAVFVLLLAILAIVFARMTKARKHAAAAGKENLEVLDCTAFFAESGNEGGEYVNLNPAENPVLKCTEQFRIDGKFTARRWRNDPDMPFLLTRQNGKYQAFATGCW